MSQNSDQFRKPLAAALEHSLSHLASLDQSHVAATADIPTLRAKVDKPLSDDGTSPKQVIADLVRDVEGGLADSPGGRFYGWVIGGSLPAALAADWLTSAWDQNAGHSACSPAAAVVEELAGKWLKEILGLPAEASFALVTGCQMAHATCLAAKQTAQRRHSLVDGVLSDGDPRPDLIEQVIGADDLASMLGKAQQQSRRPPFQPSGFSIA